MNQRIYSLPEVEKATSWKDKPAEPKIELRDSELDAAKKRTALIRERMSPADALRLPPLLEAQRQKYGIPDGFFKSQASFDRIYVFPIDPFDNDEMIPGTSLYRANLTKMKDMQEGHRGVLISAGLKAADVLISHGIELGHVVTTNKNVPFARRCEVLGDGHQMYYLVMREADLAGSETLAEEILAGKKRMVEVGDETGYEHLIATVREDGFIDTRKKKSAYINDTW